MISVISPAKKLNFNAESPINAFTQCNFLDDFKVRILFCVLQKDLFFQNCVQKLRFCPKLVHPFQR